MIEDKDLKLKVAENKQEEVYTRIKESTEERIVNSEIQIEIDKHLLEFLKTKLKDVSNA